VVVPKKTLPDAIPKVRICVDFSRLNQYVKRELYYMPTVDENLAKISGSSFFSKLDALSGYFQIPLDPLSYDLTTFITPFGRFRHRFLPMGISSASEVFMLRMQKVLQGLEGTVCHMDDILEHAPTKGQHDERLEKVLKRLSEAGLTLNRDKCLFRESEITFLGHRISSEGIAPDPTKIVAISKLPRPKNAKELRSLLGSSSNSRNLMQR
jgi:hypothetical protein